jgi:hypothetical protein
MIRTALRIGIAVTLVGMGWMAAKAQTAAPDFEIVVNAPEGETTIECVRGCGLAWVGRGVPSSVNPEQTFKFRCAGAPDGRCSSFKVGGWLRP